MLMQLLRGLQVITGSHDKTMRLWDIRALRPKTMATLTYHKKAVRPCAALAAYLLLWVPRSSHGQTGQACLLTTCTLWQTVS